MDLRRSRVLSLHKVLMATQTISRTAFQTLCAEVADAIDSGDRATAYKKLGSAKAVHAGLLAMKISDSGSSIDRQSALDGLKEAIDAAFQAATAEADDRRLVRTQTAFG